jgi:regulator of replication initiation timing
MGELEGEIYRSLNMTYNEVQSIRTMMNDLLNANRQLTDEVKGLRQDLKNKGP